MTSNMKSNIKYIRKRLRQKKIFKYQKIECIERLDNISLEYKLLKNELEEIVEIHNKITQQLRNNI